MTSNDLGKHDTAFREAENEALSRMQDRLHMLRSKWAYIDKLPKYVNFASAHNTRIQNWEKSGVVNPPDELEYYEMLEKANGICPLCGKAQGRRNLALHHDHDTGDVIGLLCTRCNLGLGQFEDDPHLLRLALNYALLHHGSKIF